MGFGVEQPPHNNSLATPEEFRQHLAAVKLSNDDGCGCRDVHFGMV